MLYKIVSLPSEEAVQYVGVYVLKWGETDQPTVAFVEADRFEVEKEAERLKTGA